MTHRHTSRVLRHVARCLLLASLMVLPLGAQSQSTARANNGIEPMVKLPPEVRLRKLHLVRPDLIQYPIDFDVYC